MKDNLKKLILWIKSHRELSAYIFFGVLTTIVSFASYFAFRFIFPDRDSVPPFLRWTFSLTGVFGADSNTALPVFLSWVITVSFAYVTNRIWVFRSAAVGFLPLMREISTFFGGRIFTLFVDLFIMFIFIDLPKVNNVFLEFCVKVAANTVVLVLNYIISKLFVFKNKKNT